jgi:AcrR family transcriptional regulator
LTFEEATRVKSAPPKLQSERRQRIIVAAIDLLEQSELEKVQMREVAERAGVALTTAYRHFGSKDHLYAAAIVQWSAQFFERIEAKGGPAGTTDEDRLRRIIRHTLRSLERSPQFIRAVILLETSSDENALEQLGVFNGRYENAMRTCLRDLDTSSAADALMIVRCVYQTEVRQWALEQTSIRSVERDLMRTVDIIFRGLQGDAATSEPG